MYPKNQYLDAAQDVPNIGERPQRNVRHLKPALIVDVTIPVHLVHFIVHEGFSHQAVHSRHVGRGELVRVELSGAAENEQFSVFALQKGK